MSETLRGGQVKGRKEYVCTLCRRKIEKGETHWYWVGVDCGKAWTQRAHNLCMKVTESWTDDEWEYSDYAEFRQELKEYIEANGMQEPTP